MTVKRQTVMNIIHEYDRMNGGLMDLVQSEIPKYMQHSWMYPDKLYKLNTGLSGEKSSQEDSAHEQRHYDHATLLGNFWARQDHLQQVKL